MPNIDCNSYGLDMIEVVARGGTRAERFRAINKHMRDNHLGMRRVFTDHSETYGFLHATYTRYQRENTDG